LHVGYGVLSQLDLRLVLLLLVVDFCELLEVVEVEHSHHQTLV
jgi:hypothetical protein